MDHLETLIKHMISFINHHPESVLYSMIASIMLSKMDRIIDLLIDLKNKK